jgi:hypothetical protein
VGDLSNGERVDKDLPMPMQGEGEGAELRRGGG